MATVIHYTGHRISGEHLRSPFAADREADVAGSIAAAFGEIDVIAGFGSLAAGADLLIAEALAARRLPLHLVFPFGIAEFRSASVAPSGKAWLTRFDRMLACAATAEVLAEPGDREAAFAACARRAMDRAVECAGQAGAAALQLAVWDGRETGLAAGTAADVATWRSRGLPTRIIAPQPPPHE